MDKGIRVLQINDDQLFNESLAALLSGHAEISLEGSLTEIHEIRGKIKSFSVEIVLINSGSNDARTINLIREIKNDNPNLKIVVMGLDNSDELILEYIEAGASGYILKDASFSQLIHAINDTHQGITHCSSQVAAAAFARINQLSQRHRRRTRTRGPALTPREKNILELVATGLGNKEIAERLHISLYTVKNHVHNILEKLQVKYRREALQRAYKIGLLEHPRPGRISAQRG